MEEQLGGLQKAKVEQETSPNEELREKGEEAKQFDEKLKSEKQKVKTLSTEKETQSILLNWIIRKKKTEIGGLEATLEAKEKRLTSAANQKSLAIDQIAQLINAALPLLVGNPEVWKAVVTDLMTRLDVTFTVKDCQRTWIFYPPLTNETRYIEELIQNQTTTILAF
jgi:hypothetical protein